MTSFDKICIKHNLYKVYTIGDCYVVLGVVDIQKRNAAKEARSVLMMSLDMVNIIMKVREQINFYQLNMRIGIHTVS
jgi:class 3 adenylate cyclase